MTGLLPPEHPLAMPQQSFAADFADANAPGPARLRGTGAWRALAFLPAFIATAALLGVMIGWFRGDGIGTLEWLLITLICFNFFWISLSLSVVASGFAALASRPRLPRGVPAPAMRVALLIPIYNEVPWDVFGNACAMLEELRRRGGPHRYALFVLSDTRDEALARQESRAVETLRATLGAQAPLYYRRRSDNSGRKVGNIAEWTRRWGGGYEAMLILDADSLMSGRAISRLVDALASDPGAGLIQSFPHLIGAQSFFARAQQFANGIYGAALAEGVARWSGQEGNYWGHNAILRTRAFAACAGLPRLGRDTGGQGAEIMSHDFVEAGLLRRAGWGVRFLPGIRGSYEETPPTLIDHILRDRRWCQGNLQHLRLLGARGFHPVSRFHMLHGAVGYLLSPLWFCLLLIWALIGKGDANSVLVYFSPDNPLVPNWPELSEGRHLFVLLLMYAMLLAPKFLGALALRLTGRRYRDLGGGGNFAASVLVEILLSIAYAPIMMVQQMIAVIRSAFGLQHGWAPQRRNGGRYSLAELTWMHTLETLSGALLMSGILAGLVTLWLLPIALSLSLAIPLSALSGLKLRGAAGWVLGTGETFREPRIWRAARQYRAVLRDEVAGQGTGRHPAE